MVCNKFKIYFAIKTSASLPTLFVLIEAVTQTTEFELTNILELDKFRFLKIVLCLG